MTLVKEPPLQQWEIDEWLETLAPNDRLRAIRIRDLLHNAGQDHMTPEDRTICVNSLKILEERCEHS